MAFRKIYDGLRLIAKALGTSSKLGDIEAIDADSNGEGIVTLHNGDSASQILTAEHQATVSNKTLDDSNVIDGAQIIDPDFEAEELTLKEITSPANPAAGEHKFYINEDNNDLELKNSSGNITKFVKQATSSNVVYGTDVLEDETTIPYSSSATSNYIVQRDSNGSAKVETLSDSNMSAEGQDIANRLYVRRKVIVDSNDTTATEGGSLSISTNTNSNVYYIGAASDLNSYTINLPNLKDNVDSFKAYEYSFIFSTTINSLSITTAGGSSLNFSINHAQAGDSFSVVFDNTDNIWYLKTQYSRDLNNVQAEHLSVRLLDDSSTSLPTGSVAIDGDTVIVEDVVLFTALSSDPGIYRAKGTIGDDTITGWDQVLSFRGSFTPNAGDQVYVRGGSNYINTLQTFDGSVWYDSPIAGSGLSKTLNTLSVNVDNTTTEINSGNVIVKSGGISNTQVNASAAIDRSKLANGTASHVIINDGSGVLSSEATLAKSRGGSGQDNSSITFPASGTLATLAGTEVLTNKDIDGGTASNTSRLTLPKNTKANLDGLTRKEGTVVYATDQAKAFIDNGTSLVQIGSGSGGGGINYIENPDAEVNTDGWTSTRRIIVGNTETVSDVFDTATQDNPYTFTENEPLISFNVSGLTAGTTYYSKNATSVETQFSSTPGGSALNINTGISSVIVSPNFSGFYIGSSISTWTRSTSSPLRGTASFLLTKPASLCVGDVHYYAFTIDDADKAKVMQIGFDYAVASGTYSTGDVIVRIRDVTNGTIIQPSAFQIENVGVASTARLTFQTAANSNDYELIFNVVTVSTSDFTLKFDNIVLGPQVVPMGAPVTDAVAKTTSGSWVSNTTYTMKERQVGDFAEYTVRIALSGAPTAAVLTVNLPAGRVIDTSKLASGTSPVELPGGDGSLFDNGSYYGAVKVLYSSTTAVEIRASSIANPASYSQVTATTPITFANGDSIDFSFRVPIVGWSSSTVVSSSADTRVVSFKAYRNGDQTGVNTNSSSVKIAFNATADDTHSGFDTSNNRYVAKIPGRYVFQSQIFINSTNVLTATRYEARLYINGALAESINCEVTASATIQMQRGGSFSPVFLRTNEYAEVFFYGSGNNSSSTLTALGGSSLTYFSGFMLQGPSQIQASEVVAWAGRSSAGTSIGTSTTTIPFATTDFDTHGAYSSGTFTVPAPGKYEVEATIALSSQSWTVGSYVDLRIVINGSSSRIVKWLAPRSATFEPDSLTVRHRLDLKAGDTISFGASQNETGSGRTLAANAAYNFASISRLGGV